MDINEKINFINTEKKKFDNLITNTYEKLSTSLDKINIAYEQHRNFIDYIKIIKIYEKYKWDNFKNEYNIIKKNITKDKKLLYEVTKFHGNIIKYYLTNEIENINHKIQEISNNTELLLYKFNKLRRIHEDLANICKNMSKNANILKINMLTEEIKPLLNKLYNNYLNTKILRHEINKYKTIKRQIITKINKFIKN